MAKSPSDPEKGADKAATAAETQAPAGGQQQAAAPQIQLDDSSVVSCYANFCRVTGTPEELIVDFGLNTQPVGVPDKPVLVQQRIIVNHYTAKRLLAALQMSIQRHESAFGVLETDIRKRVQMQPGTTPPTAS